LRRLHRQHLDDGYSSLKLTFVLAHQLSGPPLFATLSHDHSFIEPPLSKGDV